MQTHVSLSLSIYIEREIYLHTHVYIYTSIYIYIYTSSLKSSMSKRVYIYIYALSIYIYIYNKLYRKRERQRERKRQRERGRDLDVHWISQFPLGDTVFLFAEEKAYALGRTSAESTPVLSLRSLGVAGILTSRRRAERLLRYTHGRPFPRPVSARKGAWLGHTLGGVAPRVQPQLPENKAIHTKVTTSQDDDASWWLGLPTITDAHLRLAMITAAASWIPKASCDSRWVWQPPQAWGLGWCKVCVCVCMCMYVYA